jgi:aspartate 1-decarboxylase
MAILAILKSKIHFGRLTGADVNYEGSIGISRELMDLADILPYEQVLVANAENGARLFTYAIPVEEPGQLILNGAAAHHGKVGDRVIIMAFAQVTREEAINFKPKVVKPRNGNRIE